jgi:transcription-repair coupling factor (superfamily II helicase)
MADRFGALPPSVSALLLLVRVKFAARRAGIGRVAISDRGEISLSFAGEAGLVRERIMRFMQSCGRQCAVLADDQQTVLKLKLSSTGKTERAQEALAVIGAGKQVDIL